MQLETHEVTGSKLDLIEALSNHLTALDRSRFAQVDDSFVYDDVLKASRRFEFDKEMYVRDNGAIVNLDALEQKLLYQKASDKLGIDITYIPLGTIRKAAYEIKEFKDNVLKRYWMNTGEFIFKNNSALEVRELEKVEPKEVAVLDYMAKDENGNSLGASVADKKTILEGTFGRVLQTDAAKHSGRYGTLSGRVPSSNEVSSEGIDRWGGTHLDRYDIASVGSDWGSGVLGAVAGRPLDRGDVGALGVWTRENPKK